MTEQTPPIINTPSSTAEQENTGLNGLLEVLKGKAFSDLDCCLPARVKAFDRASNRATVEPMYKVTSTGGDTLQLAQIDSVPVFNFGGGGAFINFDLKENDLGWIIANDQDISLFLQNYESSPGNTKRNHSFSDAFFLPDIMHDYYLSGKEGEAAIQTQQGTTYITISEGKIDIQVGGVFTYVMDADLKGEKNITIPKDSIAKSGNNNFRLLADVTLDSSGAGKGNFKSLVIGEIDCPENSLTEIVTKVAGWVLVNNENKGEPQGEPKGITITGEGIAINTSKVTINATDITLNSPTNIHGDVKVWGNILATGKIAGDQQL